MLTTARRYECRLSEELLTKAHKELHEPLENGERLQCIDQLLTAYKVKYPKQHLKPAEQEDRFLLRFLRARKFDINRSVLMMNNYILRQQTFPEAFERAGNEQLMHTFLATKCITIINGTARNGSSLVLVRPCHGWENHDPKIYDVFSTAFYAVDKLLQDEAVQIHGVTVIEDFNYINMKIVRQMGPVIGKKFASILQETMPMRLKNLCFLNGSALFNIVFTIFGPFLKEKTKKRVVVVGKEWKKLHEIVEPRYLPETYAGHIKELNIKSLSSMDVAGTSTAIST